MAAGREENRKHHRSLCINSIKYCIQLHSSTENEHSFEGITINVSPAGIGLIAFQPLTEGQILKMDMHMTKSSRPRATVQWVNRINDELYKVGLMFLKPSP